MRGTNRADLWCTITLIEGIIIYFTVINGAWEGNIQENVMTVHRTRDKFSIEYIKYQESFGDYNNALFEADKLLKKPPIIRDICLFWINNKSGVSEIGKRLKLCYITLQKYHENRKSTNTLL